MPEFDLPPLERWTFQTVLDLARIHEFEHGQFDYKSVLTGSGPQRDEVLASIQRTACSLANSDGGYILFGVKDRREQVGTPDERLIGIPLGGDLRKQFGDKVQHVQRELHFDTVPQPLLLPTDSSRGVFVVGIPLSPLRPHRTPDGVFHRRGDGGSAIAMSYYEVRDQMLLSDERLRRASLLLLELNHYRRQATKLLGMDRAVVTSLIRFDTTAIKPLLAEVVVLVPKDHPLLSEVLDIVDAAAAFNILMEQNSHRQSLISELELNMETERIRGHLTELVRLCSLCEPRLEELVPRGN